jgi:diguanylate cyclase (GGDEF)-like protein
MALTLPEIVANALLLAGVATLAAAFVPLRSIIAQLPPGPVQKKWYLHAGYVAGFIGAYVCYATLALGSHDDVSALLVPVVFFFGACFVWRTVTLAHRTVGELHRVALLEHESITDHLTGVHNRRYLERRLEEENQRARRYGWPLAVLMLDLDRFKEVNDRYGHRAGDAVLKQFGALCQATIRATDIAARYGGDELVVVAPATTSAQALALAERLRRAVEQHVVKIDAARHGVTDLRFTASIGVAVISAGNDGAPALLTAADRALYRAKAAGRNNVSLAPNASDDVVQNTRPALQPLQA